MPTDRGHGAGARLSVLTARGLVLGFTGAVAVACLGLALLVLPVRLWQLPADDTRAALSESAEMARPALDALMLNRRQALAWHRNPESLSDLADAAFRRAALAGFDPMRGRAAIDQSLAAGKEALQLAPFDPYGWQQRAYLEEMAGRYPPAIQALRLSLDTGPSEPALMVLRIEAMIRMWDKLPADMKADMPFVISSGWKLDPNGLAASSVNGHFTGMVEQALADEPMALAAYREKRASIR